ncbi:MAG: leucine-rich repeat domain-containing protein [Faecousia sp.]
MTAIGNAAFAQNKTLTKVILPSTLTVIGDKAFYNCWMLTQAAIPEGTVSIGDDAFNFCRSLLAVVIPDSVASIGKEAFARCDLLQSVSIGKGLKNLGDGAFFCDGALAAFTVHPENTVFSVADQVLFSNRQTKLVHYPNRRQGASYMVPASVTSIGNFAFAWNQGLESVTLPDTVETIGRSAFYVARISEIKLGRGVRAIGECAFEQCGQLKNVTFPCRLKYIGEAAFCQCRSITEVYIPDSVVSVGAHAFQLCTGVTDVVIGKNVSFIGRKAFAGTNYTAPGNQMHIQRFTVLNRTVPIDVFTFDYNPHMILYGYADNISLKERAGSTMKFQVIPQDVKLCG